MGEKFWIDLGLSAIFGVLGIVLAVLGFKVFDWVTPHIKVEEELAHKQNMAVAVVAAAVIHGVCYIAAHVVKG